MLRFEFELRTLRFVLPLSLVRLKNRVCLSCGVQVISVAYRAVMRIVTRVEDLVQRIGDGRIGRVFGGRVIERSDGDEKCGFLG
jgi:hypothetical protein